VTWKLINSQFIKKHFLKSIAWDPWLLSDGQKYWIFYLTNKPEDSPHEWWTNGEIALAVSNDLYKFENIGVILRPDPDVPWESKRTCAGSAIIENNNYYLFYSAAGEHSVLDEKIGLAMSTDGIKWRRYKKNPIINIEIDNPWYGPSLREGQLHAQCRDPYVVKNMGDGKYYLFFSTSLKTESPMEYSGCVGVAVSSNIEGPYEFLPPATSHIPGLDQSFTHEMERPQIIRRKGTYHLFWSTFTFLLNKSWNIERNFDDHSKTFHFVSKNLTGPYLPHPTHPLVQIPANTTLHGINLFPVSGEEDILFFYGWNYITKKIVVNPSNTFKWNGDVSAKHLPIVRSMMGKHRLD